jgi:hypothetical protein
MTVEGLCTTVEVPYAGLATVAFEGTGPVELCQLDCWFAWWRGRATVAVIIGKDCKEAGVRISLM